MKSYWKKRLTAIALVCLMVLMMVPETALSVYAADEDEILVGAEEIVEQDAEVPEEAVELPEISEVYPETLEGSEEEFVEEDAEEVIIEDAPVILEEEAEPEIQSEVPEIYDEEIEVADPAADGVKVAEAEELVGAAASTKIVVKKEWADGAQNHGSDTVTVRVQGGSIDKTVTFGKGDDNTWQTTIELPAGQYTVDETLVNGQSIAGKYEATVVPGTPRTQKEWVQQELGHVISGETYVFTYTSNGTSYALGRSGTDVVGSTSGLTNRVPNANITNDNRWTVTASGSNYKLQNKGNSRYIYNYGNLSSLGFPTHVGLNNSGDNVSISSNGHLSFGSYVIRVNGSAISAHIVSELDSGVFTPWLLTDVTTTEYTITNTKINDYQLVYDANGGTGAPAAQTASTTATSQTFTISDTEEPTREGYEFVGWATTSTATTADVGSTVTVTTSDPQVNGVYTKTIYAVWKKINNYKLVYDANGGTGAPADQLSEPTTATSYAFTVSNTKPTREGGYEFAGWSTTPGADTVDVESPVTVTTSDTPVDGVYTKTIYAVWREVFYVYHTGVGGGNLETICRNTLTNGKYDLTQNLTPNTLYGGYYLEDDVEKLNGDTAYDGSNWTFTNAQSVPGNAITPQRGVTYYVKEVPKYYLNPASYIIYNTSDMKNNGYKVVKIFSMTAVDDRNYSEVGFNVVGKKGISNATFKSLASKLYSEFDIKKGESIYAKLTAKEMYDHDGYLAFIETTESLLVENGMYTMVPYWVTPDGFTVTASYMYVQSIGDGYYYNWESPGITKRLMGTTSKCTPGETKSLLKKMAVGRYLLSDDQSSTEDVEPAESQTEETEPTEILEPTEEPSEDVEPITTPLEVPNETVEPTNPPIEETEPTVSTVEEPETETVTMVPTAPSSSKESTSTSGPLASLLRILKSIFR